MLKKIYSDLIDILFISWKSIRIIMGPGNCRFMPSCSEYSKDALKRYGFIKGCFISFRRIMKCNLLSKGGYDPL
ncbi:MAG: membrane protein insertion efficiency factor YidD [Elusimicrobiales bacterium]